MLLGKALPYEAGTVEVMDNSGNIGGLTRSIARDKGANQIRKVPIIGQLPGTRTEV